MQYKEFENLIRSLAYKYAKTKTDVDELLSIGNLSFVKASFKYDGRDGCRSTFFYRCIDNGMKDWLRKNQTYKRMVVNIKSSDSSSFDEDYIEALSICHIDPEKQYAFIEGVFSLSDYSKCMIKDLLHDPLSLFKKAEIKSRLFLKKAFKQLMIEYGYTEEMIEYAMNEITEYLKEN